MKTHRRLGRFALLALAASAVTASVAQAGAVKAASPSASAAPARTVSVPILMYHRIDKLLPSLPAMTRRLTVEPRTFARQMWWLATHGYHAITQAQLYQALEHGRPLPRRPVMVTFDDGYRDVYQYAVPVLARLRMPATAYVITGRISGTDPSFLTWNMLRKMEAAGVEIGSHTVSHADLPALSDTPALAELVRSRRVLEQQLGHPVRWLAYPYGHYDARTVALTRRAGYLLAVTTEQGCRQRSDDLLRLERYEILDTTGIAGLAALVR